MQAIIVSRPVSVRGFGQSRHMEPVVSFDKPAVSRIHIVSAGEIEAVTTQLKQDYPDAAIQTLIRVLPHRRLASWPHFPSPLGRLADGANSESVVLPAQLQALRERHPQRRHFRLLLSNGFGTNLGDTLMGLAAFHCALPILGECLPSFTVDVLLGWQVNNAVVNLFRQCADVGEVSRQGGSLEALSRYQALFDTSGLIMLPRYSEMPPVDWCLWWLGLDPAQVEAGQKRNRLAIDPADMSAVRDRLASVPGRRILLNPMASEPLRRMPKAAVSSIAQTLLESDPDIQVILDQPVKIEHPRISHFADLINSAGRVAALVAQVDGVVTTDTFLQHAADAFSTPSCTLSTSIPASHFQYYPFGRVLELPGARDLPGWGRTKVNVDQWPSMRTSYEQAWAKLPGSTVIGALNDAITARRQSQEYASAEDSLPQVPLVKDSPRSGGLLAPRGEVANDSAKHFRLQLFSLGQQLVASGDTVILLGAGSGELALDFARQVAPTGRLMAFDHRRLIHQILCANIARAGYTHVETHCALPVGPVFNMAQTPLLDPDDDHFAHASGNQMIREQVPAWPLDSMSVNRCRLIVMQRPTPMLDALRGLHATLKRLKPAVLAAGVNRAQLPQWIALLDPLGYRLRVFKLDQDGNLTAAAQDADGSAVLMVIAEPKMPSSNAPADGAGS